MAYSPIEQRYIDMVVEGYFPTMPTEPAPAAEEASLEGVQLAAGPSETRTDMGEARLIKPSGAMGVLKSVGQIIQSGAEKIDFDVLGLPGIGTLTLKDLTVGDLGKVLVDIAEGFPPVTGKGETLKPTLESIELINAAPAVAGTVKLAKKAAPKIAESLGPTINKIAEDYLTKTGAILKMAPNSPGIEVPAAPKVDTLAFKKWFGNSKIVGKEGKPLVVYHGTQRALDGINQFLSNTGYAGQKTAGVIWFTDSADEAAHYANWVKGAGNPTVYPMYLSIQNPASLNDFYKVARELRLSGDPQVDLYNQKVVRQLKAQGFDGVRWTENEYTESNNIDNLSTIVAFSPEQVKSIFNKGTFDPKDPRILYGGGAAGAATMQDEEKK